MLNINIDCWILICFILCVIRKIYNIKNVIGLHILSWKKYISKDPRKGRPNTIVEKDETKIGKKKYNYGQIVKENWIFGGASVIREKFFLFFSMSVLHTKTTLLKI